MASERCFPRQYRLTQSQDFQQVFSHTLCKSYDNCFTLLACQNHRDYPRLGLAITKKKIRTAVARNRIKRLIRESFRHHLDNLKGLDIVVLGQSRAIMVTNEDLFNSLHNHWLNLAKRSMRK